MSVQLILDVVLSNLLQVALPGGKGPPKYIYMYVYRWDTFSATLMCEKCVSGRDIKTIEPGLSCHYRKADSCRCCRREKYTGGIERRTMGL